MKKTHFTRKNFIAIGIFYFYILITVFAAMCIDANGLMVATNPVKSLANLLSLPNIDASFGTYIMFSMFAVYSLLFVAAFIYEMRLAKYYEDKAFSTKWVVTYLITLVICLVFPFGIGVIAHLPITDFSLVMNSLLYVVESYFIGLLLFILVGSIVLFGVMLYINFKNIDKPFRFFKGDFVEKSEIEDEIKDLQEEATQVKQGLLASSFGVNQETKGGLTPNVIGGENAGSVSLKDDDNELTKEKVFPSLCEIDTIAEFEPDNFDDNVSLEDLVINFRNYLAKKEKLYFDLDTIRCFVSALSASHLIILEGLSGTGKSSLARYFSTFINEKSFFVPVQATWRDRTSLLGFYNDFSRSYNETEFLKRLYNATYRYNHLNIMVLDEINISRVEYYFADFLSILEYPSEEWKLKIMQLPYSFKAPEHLTDGVLDITESTYFIGTANKDDSTYTITDKVYDRAITISFDDKNEYFEVDDEVKEISISYTYLQQLFREAQENNEYQLNQDDIASIKKINDFIYDTFDVTFGNRIMNQIELFVPTFIASGGKKVDALDFMLTRKVLSKLDGRFEDYVKDGLENLLTLIEQIYPREQFSRAKNYINKLLRRF